MQYKVQTQTSQQNIMQASLAEEEQRTRELGEAVMTALVGAGAANEEEERCRLHLQEAAKLSALILGLAARHARALFELTSLDKENREAEEVIHVGNVKLKI